MHRFYFENANFSQSLLAITDRHEIHHIKDVLRLKAGDELVLFNGQNQEGRCVIAEIKEAKIMVNLKEFKEQQGTGIKIILACAVPKKAKFELIIEKCTELGVNEIIPLQTKRTEVIFSKDKLKSKRDRFQKIAVNAAKQSGRTDVPIIHEMTAFSDVIQSLNKDVVAIIPSLNGKSEHILTCLTNQTNPHYVIIFIGPEGDFTPDEVQLAVKAGCRPVSLGKSVLKVDTAAIASVSLVRFMLLDKDS